MGKQFIKILPANNKLKPPYNSNQAGNILHFLLSTSFLKANKNILILLNRSKSGGVILARGVCPNEILES
jgi:hypothetical protein